MDLLSTITSEAKAKPSRLLLFAPPKWGKTSWAAYAPDPVFLMTRGEDGLLTLLAGGRVPETPHFEGEALDWATVMDAVQSLAHGRHDRKTFVLDTVNGAARLLMEQVCGEKFEGDWIAFDAYGRGLTACEAPWIQFLEALEFLRSRMSIILLCHSKVKTTKNPSGADYDQHQPEMPDKLVAHANKWADALLYGGWAIEEKKTGTPGKAKAVGGTARMIQTGGSAAHVTGNRFGLPAVIRGGDDAASMWRAFALAMQAARKAGQAAAAAKAKPAQTEPAKEAPAAPAAPATEPDPDPVGVGDPANDPPDLFDGQGGRTRLPD